MHDRCIIDRIHSQRQRNHTVTSVDSLQRVGVCSRSSKRLPKEVETLALAHHVCNRRVIDRIHRQGQCNHTVATVNRLQSIHINTCFRERIAEEVIAFALAHHVGNRRVIDGIHSQSQCNHTVATVNRRQCIDIST